MKTKFKLYIFSLLITLILVGCKSNSITQEINAPSNIICTKIDTPVVIDGKSDEVFWGNIPSYNLMLNQADALKKGTNKPQFNANFKLAYDNKNIYVFAVLFDDDLVQLADKNHQLLYKSGDNFEIFLYPNKGSKYWEFYASMNGTYSCLYFESKGRKFAADFALQKGVVLKTASQISGTINNIDDIDRYCTIELAIPLKIFSQKGYQFGVGTNWSILIARYNYSYTLDDIELTSSTHLSSQMFNTLEEFIPILFK